VAALLAIDEGTTSTRAMTFDERGFEIGRAQQEIEQHYAKDTDDLWVEHDPEEIWRRSLAVIRAALDDTEERVAAAGITNQRETTLLWDRRSGRPLARAIVWQDRRTAPLCRKLIEGGQEPLIRQTTGLVVDPYFSATKLAWLLDNIEGARPRARRGELAFGTIDTFLLWRLTGGKVHATDASNAARTMLFDIHRQRWSDDLLRLLDIPAALLPEVRDSAGMFGTADPSLIGEAIPITAIAGDQQAATFGQACLAPGMVKSTFGTGAFLLANAGASEPQPADGMLATIAWRLGGRTTYAIEGAILDAGTAIQWLRDELGLFGDMEEAERHARALPGNRGVYFVPAFSGLGAPHWDPQATGAIFGLRRYVGRSEIIRAALEAVAYQTRDLLEAMQGPSRPEIIRVDGGMARNDWLMQFLADITGSAIERPQVAESTALGAALLAGLGAGVFGSPADAARAWRLERRFEPRIAAAEREARLATWRMLIGHVREIRTR
jgi:glycerol kinase